MANWYLQNGKDSDVVVSTRVRLVRNLKGFKFVNKSSKEEQEKILNTVKDIVPSLGFGLKYIDLDDLDDVTKLSLVEKHLISPEFAINNSVKKAVIMNSEENISIMLNEDDHIKLQVFSAGQELENLTNFIIELDEKLGNAIDFKSDEEYGFIVTNPPYGERLEDKESVQSLYKHLGYTFRNLKNWSYYLITSYEDFEKEFVNAFQVSDKTYFTEVDSNREKQTDYPGINSKKIIDQIKNGEMISLDTIDKLKDETSSIVCFLGCASVDKLIDSFKNLIK